jgi:hypothetical protein
MANNSFPKNELFEELDQINQILSPDSKRSLSALQKGIIIQKRISSLSLLINRLVTSNLPIEEQNQIFEELLNQTNTIINYRPMGEEEANELYWFQLESLRLVLAASLMGSWGKAGKLRVIGSAHAISNIVLGIDDTDVEHIVVPTTHPQVLKRNPLAINLLNFRTILYYIASTSLYSIPKNYFNKWAIKAIEGSQQLLPLIHRIWDIPTFVELDRRLGQNRTQNLILASLHIFTQTIQFLLTLQQRIASDWPNLPSYITFLKTSSLEAFLNSLREILEQQDKLFQNVKEHVANGTFDINHNPLNQPQVQIILTLSSLNEITLRGLIIAQELFDHEAAEKEFSKLETVIIDLLAWGQNNKPLLDSPQFICSSVGESFFVELEKCLYIIGLYCKKTNKLKYLNEFKELFAVFLEGEGKERYPSLQGLLSLISLTIAVLNNKEKLALSLATQLVELSPAFVFQPRDSFAFHLIGHLIMLVLDEETSTEFFEAIDNRLKQVGSYIDKNLHEEITEYIDEIKKACNGEEPNYRFDRRKESNILDPYQVFIPKISLLKKDPSYSTIVYLPFNLGTDFLMEQ